MEHTKTTVPSMDAWIKEAKEDKSAPILICKSPYS